MATRTQSAEGGDADLLRLYLADIGQYALLTKDDEVALAQEMEQGHGAREELGRLGGSVTRAQHHQLLQVVRAGDRAERTFVQSNLRLVVAIAKRYQGSGVPLLDLIQEGNLGLIHAVHKFEWRKGFKFSTYASWWIRQAITRSIANTARTIRLPVHVESRLTTLHRVRADLAAQLGRQATRRELALALDISVADVEDTLRFATTPRSLSEPRSDDTSVELGELIEDRSQPSPDETAVRALLPHAVESLLGALDERERQILCLHFGLDGADARTLTEVGEQLRLSRERIRQIEAKAMSKLRHPANSDQARELLDA